ncbi:MAG: nucleotide exchange factor GrpE [Flavobacteriales bacterium]|nr:nucleotide exchange factor GrpE [Flavobacteriales bacterium]|tara:strand:- start:6604 stop:7065 length:462 start_codon:yes stop_codon:yes gene_type:complete
MAKKIKKTSTEILKKEEELIELKNKYLRLVAEFENYKKRTQKEREEFAKYAKESFIKSILPIIDDFERAQQTKENDIKGYLLIEKKLMDILSQHNLEKIKLDENEQFDLDKHEAISSIEVKQKNKKGKIIEEVEAGYLLSDKIIRYPKVIIGK